MSPNSLSKPNNRGADLRGVKVCHLSPVQGRDERVFGRQALPASEFGIRSTIIGPHGESGQVEGIEFVPLARNGNRLLRMALASAGVAAALREHADIYQVHSPTNIVSGLVLKLVFRKRVIYDAREDFPSMMLTKTYIPRRLRGWAKNFVFRAERWAALCFDGFVTADSGTLRPHAKNGSSKKLVFYNLPNLQFFPEPNGQTKRFDLVYRGGLSERAGTFVLLDAVHLLMREGLPLRLLMFGYADNRAVRRQIEEHVQSRQIGHLVTLGGVIPHAEMAATLSQARLAVCPLQRVPKFLNNIPVKVFESWACGQPVVATDLPPIRPFFLKNQQRLLVEPGDSRSLARAIRALLSQPDEMERIGKEARQTVVRRYNNRSEFRKLLSLYRAVLAA